MSGFPYEAKTDKGINYLWQLLNPEIVGGVLVGFDVSKDGFAKRTYKGGYDGVENRIKNTLADMENKLNLRRGVLKARISVVKMELLTKHYRLNNISKRKTNPLKLKCF